MARGEAALRAQLRHGRSASVSPGSAFIQRLLWWIMQLGAGLGVCDSVTAEDGGDDADPASSNRDGSCGGGDGFSREDVYDAILRLEGALALLHSCLISNAPLLHEFYLLAQVATPPAAITQSNGSTAHSTSSNDVIVVCLDASSPSSSFKRESGGTLSRRIQSVGKWGTSTVSSLRHLLLAARVTMWLAWRAGMSGGGRSDAARRAALQKLPLLRRRLRSPLERLAVDWCEFECLLCGARSLEELLGRTRRPHGQHPLHGYLINATTDARRLEEACLRKLVVARLISKHWTRALPTPLKIARQEGVLWGDVLSALTIEPSPVDSQSSTTTTTTTASSFAQRRKRRQSKEERVQAHVQAISNDCGALAEMSVLAMRDRLRDQRASVRRQSNDVRASYMIAQRANMARAKAQLEAAIRIQRAGKHWVKRVRNRLELERLHGTRPTMEGTAREGPTREGTTREGPTREGHDNSASDSRCSRCSSCLSHGGSHGDHWKRTCPPTTCRWTCPSSDPLEERRPAALSLGADRPAASLRTNRPQMSLGTPGGRAHLATPSPWRLSSASPRTVATYVAVRTSASFVHVQTQLDHLKREMWAGELLPCSNALALPTTTLFTGRATARARGPSHAPTLAMCKCHSAFRSGRS